ncbi:MAG: GDP-mannose 4,6-dehydratase, partial [Solirubrobacterales bacterium]|nr:GDP-mannose 4,6-dehydratase [Solirubrobacterales bacterium]
MAARRALITGIGGQDGSYLAEQLLADGHEVIGMVREAISVPQPNLGAVHGDIELLQGELLDPASLRAVIERAAPDELYHLAAPTFVPASWEDPTEAVNAIAGA